MAPVDMNLQMIVHIYATAAPPERRTTMSSEIRLRTADAPDAAGRSVASNPAPELRASLRCRLLVAHGAISCQVKSMRLELPSPLVAAQSQDKYTLPVALSLYSTGPKEVVARAEKGQDG